MFCDRFTGARNPARLPTTIQSRRIRYAPIAKRGWDQSPYFSPDIPILPPDYPFDTRPAPQPLAVYCKYA